MNFKDLGLSETLVKTITDLGYATPTPIQAQAIPYLIEGHDLFGCAQTGTGKTASFLLPIIDGLSKGHGKARMPRCIILEPTRELALQVQESFKKYQSGSELTSVLLMGGESMIQQEKLLKKPVDVLIATPGRLIDLFDRGLLLLANVKYFVIDEADRMLDMGFIPDVTQIASKLPKRKQTMLFSATVPKEIKKLSQDFLVNPKEVTVSRPSKAASTVEQKKVIVSLQQKRQALKAILEQVKPQSAIIFANRKSEVDKLTASLKKYGFAAESLHGDMEQRFRNQALEAFRKGELSILVASDVAARGIDITDLSLVVNYDVPSNAEEYVHRIGRTGRAGQKGLAIMITTKADEKALKAVEKVIKEQIPVLDLSLEEESEEKERKPQKKKNPPKQANQHQETDSRKLHPAPKEKAEGKKREERHPAPKNQKIIGFGDMVPAFMLVKIPGEEKFSKVSD